MSRTTLFADVILPLPVGNTFTYRVPFDWNQYIQPGQRVVVQFGKNKLYTAIVRRLHENPPQKYQAKYLENILDEQALVTENQMKFWDWMSEYYMAHPGDVLNAALPGNLKLSSETKYLLHPDFTRGERELEELEEMLVNNLETRHKLTLEEIAQILQTPKVHTLVKKAIERRVITSEEELSGGYKPKLESFIQILPEYNSEEKLNEWFKKLEKKAPKQVDVLLACLSWYMQHAGNTYMPKKELVQRVEGADGALKSLVKKGILQVVERRVDRLGGEEHDIHAPLALTPAQQQTKESIQQQWKNHEVVLLHGVTSSGKTEIYIHLIEECIKQGKQVLYMLPEIALTAQIINRLQRVFGNRVGIYHSRYNTNERAETWMRAATKGKNRIDIILGARSAVFVPFDNLGLVIIDEEHESTFKQYTPSPHYHARDAAIMLAKNANAKVLLGSATPSVESWYNARQHKYGMAQMLERHGGVKMPVITRISLREARKKKEMQGPFTPQMVASIQAALDKKEQVILFRNRRGYTPMWSCESCGWVPRCDHCDVSLTYHKHAHQLLCHYCGTTYKPHVRCGACGGQRLNMVGFGTEKIEEETQLIFPQARITRMDQDTTRNKNAHQHIIEQFEEGETDILIGTQMVTKGFDFNKVSVVGILQADATLSFPDFRAHERAFQLFTQVAGRAGRRDKRGEVIIQSGDADHPVLQLVEQNDFKLFYEIELNERKKFAYPPFTRLIQITLKHVDEGVVASGAAELAKKLRKTIGKRILGPEKPMVARIRNKYLQQIMVKLEKSADTISMKEQIRNVIDEFRQFSDFKRVQVDVDVDPV